MCLVTFTETILNRKLHFLCRYITFFPVESMRVIQNRFAKDQTNVIGKDVIRS